MLPDHETFAPDFSIAFAISSLFITRLSSNVKVSSNLRLSAHHAPVFLFAFNGDAERKYSRFVPFAISSAVMCVLFSVLFCVQAELDFAVMLFVNDLLPCTIFTGTLLPSGVVPFLSFALS